MSAAQLSLRHFATVMAIHEEGSYRRAAARLGYSQAAVTSQVAALEKALGATVFDRPGGPRPVTLTSAGREVLSTAREMMQSAAALDLRLGEIADGRAGRLAVGTFQSVSARLLPSVLQDLRGRWPNVHIRVTESDDNDVLTAALHRGHLDATFLIAPVDDRRDLNVREVLRDPFIAMVPTDDPARQCLSPADLEARPLIGHDRCVCHELAEQGFRSAGITPTFVFRSNDNVAVQAMVRAGIGTAVMPALSVDADDPGVRLVRIEPPLPARRILLAIGARPTPTAALFDDLVSRRAETLGLARFA